jgi:hypothetical protein
MDSRFVSISDHTPYSDRKLSGRDDAPLDDDTLVAIQRMDCEGRPAHEIYEAFASQGVSMERIMSLLDPPDERAVSGTARRQTRAAVGFAAFKGRR